MVSTQITPKQVSKNLLAERKEAINQMTERQRKRLEEHEALLTNHAADSLRFYHNIGRRLLKDEQEFGDKGLALILKAMHYHDDTLRKAMIFAGLYNEQQLDELILLGNPLLPGKRLTWGHVRFLIGVDSQDKREELAKKAALECMNPASLAEAIQKHYGKKRSQGGRKFGRPHTLIGKLRQIVEVTRAWVGRDTEVWSDEEDGAMVELMRIGPDAIDDDLIEKVEQAHELMDTLISQASKEKVALAEAKARLAKMRAAAGNGHEEKSAEKPAAKVAEKAKTKGRKGRLAAAK